MPPQTQCPNCGTRDWDRGELGHVPKIVWDDDRPAVDVSKGFTIMPWKCASCHYVMLFWEPDNHREN